MKTPSYTRKAIKRYLLKTKEFRKRVFPDEYDKLLELWKKLIEDRNKS